MHIVATYMSVLIYVVYEQYYLKSPLPMESLVSHSCNICLYSDLSDQVRTIYWTLFQALLFIQV